MPKLADNVITFQIDYVTCCLANISQCKGQQALQHITVTDANL